MKKFLLGFCALSLLGSSVVFAKVDHSYDNETRRAGAHEAASVAARGDNPNEKLHRKKDDVAAGVNVGLGMAGIVAQMTGFDIMGKILDGVKGMAAGLLGEAESKTVNCPVCCAAVASAATIAYPIAYANCLPVCAEFPPIQVVPTRTTMGMEDMCVACLMSIDLKMPPVLMVAPDGKALFVSAIKFATTAFLNRANAIMATFIGDKGHVTDKWVGPPPRNTIVKTMGDDIAVKASSFGAVAFDPKEYEGIKNPEKASMRELFEYRRDQLLEDQRSVKNVTAGNKRLLYRAQQRSVKALTRAMELKKQLKVLAGVDEAINAKYSNLPSSLETVASRRALYDALLELKLSVVASRTKLRAEALELEFKPKVNQEKSGAVAHSADSGIADGGEY